MPERSTHHRPPRTAVVVGNPKPASRTLAAATLLTQELTGREPDLVVDCLGRPCPVPVIELAKAVPTVEVGQVVEVLSDDPAARLDVPAWCRMRSQDYLGERARDTGSGYLVRRSG